MTELHFRMFIAGIMFGFWPLVMNRSGLNGNVSSAVFTGVALTCVLPFAIRSGGASFVGASWLVAIAAGCLGAIGLLAFNGGLAKASKETVGSLFVTMIVVQISVPAIYQFVMTRHLEVRKAIGFAAAIIAAILLA